MIYSRLNNIIELLSNNNKADFAAKINVAATTVLGYLKENGNSKIRVSFLEKVLGAFPQVSRDWLFFGEGEMLKSDAPLTLPEPTPDMTAELARMRIELDEVNRINRQLVTKLLVDGVGDKGEQTNTGKTADGAQ